MKKLSSVEWWGLFVLILTWVVVSMLLFFIVACSPKVVTVPEIHHEYHSHTDSVLMRDSVIDRQTNIIREVDSATMAQYGITLKEAERAWLIQSDRMQREIQQLKENRKDTVEVRDTVNVPYPVEVVKEPPLKDKVWWSVKCLLIALFILFLIRFIPKIRRDS